MVLAKSNTNVEGWLEEFKMNRIENEDTRYFLEVDLDTLEVIRVAFDQKQNLDKGQQMNVGIHRLFLTKGQYHKFVSRCETEIQDVLDT